MAETAATSHGWHKSSFSQGAGDCVEFKRGTTGEVLIRDSKDPAGAMLSFTTGEWKAFLSGVRNSEFEV